MWCSTLLQGPIAIKMAKIAIDNGMQVILLTFYVCSLFNIIHFVLQADISTGLKIEEACYAQVLCLIVAICLYGNDKLP